MDDITDTLASYAQVCELSSGVRDLLRAARADILDLRARFAVVEDKYFDVLKHWNETCAELDRLSKSEAFWRKEADAARAELAAERERRGEYAVSCGRLDIKLAKAHDALREARKYMQSPALRARIDALLGGTDEG